MCQSIQVRCQVSFMCTYTNEWGPALQHVVIRDIPRCSVAIRRGGEGGGGTFATEEIAPAGVLSDRSVESIWKIVKPDCYVL